jgi:hypothetical protein
MDIRRGPFKDNTTWLPDSQNKIEIVFIFVSFSFEFSDHLFNLVTTVAMQ